jgi:hypothetical protein
MIARVDGEVVPPSSLWWPELNFDQFRWPGRVDDYELEIARADFVDRLAIVYQQCVAELRADDKLVPGGHSPLTNADYPSLDKLPDHPAAFFEAVRVYLWNNLFAAFLPGPAEAGRFMVNSIDSVSASSAVVVVRGRGYHGAPGFAREED